MNGYISDAQFRQAMTAQYPASTYLDEAYKLCQLLRMTAEGEKQFLLRIGLAKELCDEMLPLGYLCKHYFSSSPDVSIQLVLGNQSYDAIGIDTRHGGCVKFHIEITGIEDGSEHTKRKQLHDSANGSVVDTYSSAEEIRRQDALLREVICKKGSKKYPADTLLLIYLKSDYNLPGWMDTVFNVGGDLGNKLSRFQRVLLMGSRQIYMDYQTDPPIGMVQITQNVPDGGSFGGAATQVC